MSACGTLMWCGRIPATVWVWVAVCCDEVTSLLLMYLNVETIGVRIWHQWP